MIADTYDCWIIAMCIAQCPSYAVASSTIAISFSVKPCNAYTMRSILRSAWLNRSLVVSSAHKERYIRSHNITIMESTCSNCDETITLQYCPSCGQKKYRRIDKKYLIEEMQYTLLHVNKGFLYSVKSLLRNPGKTAREYIEGSRVNHYKPILLAVLTSGLYAFISMKFIDPSAIYAKSVSDDAQGAQDMKGIADFMLRYWNFITLALIPLFAILTRFVFRKQEENYFEHIVMNAYLQSLFSLLYILIFIPVSLFLVSNPSLFLMWNNMALLFYPIGLVWFFRTYYPDLKLSAIIGKVLLLFFIVMLAGLAVSVLYAVYLMQTGRV